MFRSRPDVNAVVHCHTPSLIPFADSTVPLRPMYHQSAFLAAGVPVFEIRQAAGMTNMLIETVPLGRALAKAMADKPALLMRGHGAVVVADTIPNVVGRSIYLDLNARIQSQAIALGGKITYIDPEEARKYAGVRQLQPGVGAVEKESDFEVVQAFRPAVDTAARFCLNVGRPF